MRFATGTAWKPWIFWNLAKLTKKLILLGNERSVTIQGKKGLRIENCAVNWDNFVARISKEEPFFHFLVTYRYVVEKIVSRPERTLGNGTLRAHLFFWWSVWLLCFRGSKKWEKQQFFLKSADECNYKMERDAFKTDFLVFQKDVQYVELIELLGSEADYYPWRNIK